MRLLLVLTALGAAPCAAAPELATVTARAGVTQPFVILPLENRAPQAIALLYIGGGGRINARREDGEVKFGARNFLPRSAAEFARNGVLPVVMDAPSDQAELTEGYRSGPQQSEDARAVLAELKRRFPGVPLYLVGTSRGTISAAFVGRDLAGELAGVVLTSTMFGGSNPRREAPTLRGFDYGSIRTRLLFVHHREDACEHTPYSGAERVAAKYELVSVSGGKPAESAACEPFSAHGYFGVEAGAVDALTAWMLKRPFPRQVP